MTQRDDRSTYIRPFGTIGIGDIASVGGKNASLGEMYRELTTKGVKVPNGFAVTADGYWYFLRQSGLDRRLRQILEGLDTGDLDNLRQRGRQARAAILEASLPDDLERAIVTAYDGLSEGSTGPLDVAVRSSATAEDLPDASFAGQQESLSERPGRVRSCWIACKRCFASLYTDRAISYRVDKGFDHFKVGLSIGVQQHGAVGSGRLGRDVLDRYRDRLPRRRADQRLVWSGRERGSGVGQSGRILCLQADSEAGLPADPAENGRHQGVKLIYDVGGGKMTKNVPVPPEDRDRFASTTTRS